ncbi:MAG: glycosyltransferase family 4 protein [Anaerolineae bacterium]
MRIVLDGRPAGGHFPGIGRYVYHLARALAEAEPALELLLLYEPHMEAPWRALARKFSNLTLVPAPWSPFSPASQLVIPRLLRSLNADLYHATYYLMPYFAGLPTVLTLYDLVPLRVPTALSPGWKRYVYYLLHRLAVRRAGLCLAISHAAARDMTELLGVPPARLRVTYLAPDPRFRPPQDRAEIERWKQARGLPARYVLYVGINKPHKNLERLVRAWELVMARWRSAWGERPALLWAGPQDPRFPQAVEAFRREGTSAYALGRLPDEELVRLYQGAELLVHPSLYEGFGLPVLEAMACGVPVACSDRPALNEVAGPAALLFDPEDEEAMAGAVLGLLTSPERRQALAQVGITRAAGFTWSATARATLSAYGELMGRPAQEG